MPDANDGDKSDDNSNDGNENSQEELGKPCTGDAKCKSDYCDPNKSICATRPQAPSPSSNDEIECKKPAHASPGKERKKRHEQQGDRSGNKKAVAPVENSAVPRQAIPEILDIEAALDP